MLGSAALAADAAHLLAALPRFSPARTVDFPRIAFAYERVEAGGDGSGAVYKEDLHHGLAAHPLPRPELHAPRLDEPGVVVADHIRESLQRETLLDGGGGLTVGRREIVAATGAELFAHDVKERRRSQPLGLNTVPTPPWRTR